MEKVLDTKLRERNKENTERKKLNDKGTQHTHTHTHTHTTQHTREGLPKTHYQTIGTVYTR